MINILLLNWNSSSDVVLALQNILKSSYTTFRIILIDNFSEQDDITKIYETYRDTIEIHLVLNNDNYGYAGGNNRGYDYLVKNNLEGDILILNPDVAISNNTLFEFQKILDENIGGVMARTLDLNGSTIYDYIELNGCSQKWLMTDKAVIDTDYLAGSCMLLKRSVIDKVGLFEENFFLYWEEVELSLRIKTNGYKIVSTTSTTIKRKDNEKKRTLLSCYYLTRNVFLLKKKNYISGFSVLNYIYRELILTVYRVIKFKESAYLKYYFQGLFDGLKGKFGKYE